MNVALIGTGYVGLVTGAGLASVGHRVTCIDSNLEKIAALRRGELPFVEPGLPELVSRGVATGHLHFTHETKEGCLGAEVIILAVGTPSNGQGEADLTALRDCARRLADFLRHRCVVVIKSTVPPGTCEAVQAVFDSRRPGGRSVIRVASNPEFLAEGTAVDDFCQPARIAMVNELANIALACDADISSVFRVVGSDPRIGPRYLQPGPGFGGSCLPKDLRALYDIAVRHGEDGTLLQSVQQTNQAQLDRLVSAVGNIFPDGFDGRLITIWGLAFKPGTDDVRESPALRFTDRLLMAGARVQVCDPAVSRLPQMDRPLLSIHADPVDACTGAELLCVMTRWPEFLNPDWRAVASKMSRALVLDPHFLYDAATVQRSGLRYLGAGSRSMT